MAWPQDHLPVLKRNRQHIVENIDLVYTELWDVLVRRDVLSIVQSRKIQEFHSSDEEQAAALLNLLEKRPTYVFIEFLKALQETHHKDMVDFLAGEFGYVIGSDEVQDIAEGMRNICTGNLKASTREFYEQVKHKSYDLTGPEKGRVLIVHISKNRYGSEVDKQKMNDLFQDLGFKVMTVEDPDYLQLQSTMATFATSEQNRTTKSVFVVLSALGGMKRNRPFMRLADDSEFYFKDSVDDLFSSQNAPHLINKPKVFLLQVSMGQQVDEGVLLTTFGDPVRETVEFDGPKINVKKKETWVPQIFDCLYAFAAGPGYKAVRDAIDGSLFLNEISHVFRADAHDTHVSDMLVTVRRNITEKTGQRAVERTERNRLQEGTFEETSVFVQTTHNVDMLSKRLFLFPGI